MLRYFTLAAALIASPTLAQDGSEVLSNRTPASAQKFLAATPPQGFWFDRGNYKREGEVSSTDACTTRMSGQPGSADASGVWSLTLQVRGRPDILTINWSKIELVESGSSGDRYIVMLKSSGEIQSQDIWLYYSLATVRDRVLSAALYLQQACDQKKDLGF